MESEAGPGDFAQPPAPIVAPPPVAPAPVVAPVPSQDSLELKVAPVESPAEEPKLAEPAPAARTSAAREHARSHIDIPQARPMAAAIAYALHAPALMPAHPAEASDEPPLSESAMDASATVVADEAAPPPAAP